ncbi:MAG TPA: prolyl oligopeptidase family serine peptidase, partial [Longimicrobium sp.]|nr:prolyl oligopeptidase family serine peptidase [Longimicrobium sp.]
HPAQISDAKAAVRFLRAYAPRFLLDSARVAAWGGSAGGYLAAMLATTADVASLDDPSLGHQEQPSRVQALVAFYPLVDFTTLDAQMAARRCGLFDGVEWGSPGSAVSRLLGFTVADDAVRATAASPLAYLGPDDPPTLIVHGAIDCTVPVDQAWQLYEAVDAVLADDQVRLRVLPDAGHGGPEFDTADVAGEVARFLAQHMR